MKTPDLFITVLGAIGLLAIFSFLLSWPTYMLWNGCLVGAVNGVNEVTWLQAWGLNLLVGFMFKSGLSTSKKD
jgi:hypothetical protein